MTSIHCGYSGRKFDIWALSYYKPSSFFENRDSLLSGKYSNFLNSELVVYVIYANILLTHWLLCVFLLANVIRSALRILIRFGDRFMSSEDTQHG